MIIALEQAGVLATIIPIGLLIIGFEVRSVPSVVATGRAGTVALWFLGALLLSGLLFGFFAEYLLVQAMLAGRDVDAISTVFVRIGLALVANASLLLLLASLGHALGLTHRLGRRARDRTMSSPRRFARQMRYIDEHHPNWRDAE